MAETRTVTRRMVTPEQLKEGYFEFNPNNVPNMTRHEYRNPVKKSDGNWEVDAPSTEQDIINLRDKDTGKIKRYAPDPYQMYGCPYCNQPLRLLDADAVVDSYQNVCHLICFDNNCAEVDRG